MKPRLGVLLFGFVLAPLAGCHRSSDSSEPTPARDVGPREIHFPGVELTRTPGGGVLIRPIGGVVGGNQPLFVIDGTPTMVDPRRGIDWLTPEQIANVEFIKDPAKTAIYGPQGAHGVILVTTKRNR